jgi:hypothetical protein
MAPGRFLLFAYRRHEENGGMGDYCGSFDTIGDLSTYVLGDPQKWMRNREDVWVETFDLRRGLVAKVHLHPEHNVVICDDWAPARDA